MLTHIEPNDLRRTRQFIRAWILREDGAWFELAQYHDIGFDKHGPADLAAFLGLDVGKVFPIHYDISEVVVGIPEVVRGTIPAEPVER